MSQTKQCTKCYKFKPLDLFYKVDFIKSGRLSHCIDCQKQRAKNLRSNPEFMEKERIRGRRRYERLKNGELPHRANALKIRQNNLNTINTICRNLGNVDRMLDSTFLNHFGCSKKVFVNRFERYFKENPGMGWNNYGAWQMDHIKPLKEFKLDTEANRKLANHYTNLRPEWGLNNLQKGAKYEMEQTI